MSNILKKAESFVTGLFEKNNTDHLLFHNLEHTKTVVARAKEIASQYELSETDETILYTAAWFHDTGHLFVEPAMHEIKSAELVKDFFARHIIDGEALVGPIENCIMATRIPRNPKTVPEQIICDADTYHLGTKDFKTTNKLLRKEYIQRKLIPENTNWNKKSLEFLESHRYYTAYCQSLLDEGKQKNIERLQKKLLNDTVAELSPGDTGKGSGKDGAADQKKSSLLSKGIQTMLRLTSDNHLELSGMADGKANILISVNAIIISVILSVLLRRLEIDTYLTIPTITFLVFSLTTIVIAILATRPKISGGRFSKEDILNKRTNLLFFGNFHKATLQEYEWGMREMMKDEDYLYGALIKDIYYLGVVLGKKYKLIRIAYFVFMIGIIISVLAFAIAVMLNRGGTSSSTAMPL
jgi:predicted metal-dependent HD superfamily phosphohydrolase